MFEQEVLVSEQDLTNEQDYEKGIDVSHYQGSIDWKSVAASGIKHVFIKMSEGGNYTDNKFLDNWHGAKEAGINVHVYHYFRALSSTPKEQFINIQKNLESIDFNPRNNLLAIDVEQAGNEKATRDQMADHLHELLELIEKSNILCGVHPVIYCSAGYWDYKVNWEKYDFSNNLLWVVNWNAIKPSLPQTWENSGRTWLVWQHSSIGKVNGIAGDVDLNWVNLALARQLDLSFLSIMSV